MSNKTIRKVFVKELKDNVNPFLQSDFEISDVEGTIPGIYVEYEDGDKFLIIVTSASIFSFRDKHVSFEVEEYFWNNKLNKWDRTNTNSFSSNLVTISNNNLVNVANGEDREKYYQLVDNLEQPINDIEGNITGYNKKEGLINEEDSNITFVGEFDYWLNQIGKTILIPPLLNSIEELFTKKFPDT